MQRWTSEALTSGNADSIQASDQTKDDADRGQDLDQPLERALPTSVAASMTTTSGLTTARMWPSQGGFADRVGTGVTPPAFRGPALALARQTSQKPLGADQHTVE